jgi:hypothetical protein
MYFKKIVGLGILLSSFYFDKNLPNINKTKHPKTGKRNVKNGRIQV